MSIAQKLQVDLGQRSYDIVIGSDVLANADQYVKQVSSAKHYVIVTDDNIAEKCQYAQQLQQQLQNLPEVRVDLIVIKAGENAKSFAQLQDLLDQIFTTVPDRKTTLIALGGGVIGDLTGFAASILLRGVDFIQIPTTLLAQVDSSVGGKTGINNKFGKNLIGSFYQPKLVLIDIASLTSLPEREFLAGYAEVVKYGLINDHEFFSWLDSNLDDILAKKPEALNYIIEKSCAAKASIVAQDEREGGVRALLNLGHTFGHALEQQCGYDGTLYHGEAVSIGMVFAFTLSHQLGLCSADDIEQVSEHLLRAGLMVSPKDIQPDWDIDQLMKAMAQDKKVSDGKLVFILAKAIGESFIQKDVDANIVRDTIANIVK